MVGQERSTVHEMMSAVELWEIMGDGFLPA